MSDDALNPPAQPSEIDKMSVEDLASMIEANRPTTVLGEDHLADAPEPVAAADDAGEEEAADPGAKDEATADDDEKPEPKAAADHEKGDDPAKPAEAPTPTLEGESHRITRAEKELAELRLHAARLATKLDLAEKKLNQRTRPQQAQDDAADAPLDDDLDREEPARRTRRPDATEERLSALETRLASEAARSAVMEEAQRFAAMPDMQTLSKEEAAEALKPYADDWRDAMSSTDVKQARMLARAVLGAVLADARSARDEARQAEAQRRSADEAESMKKKKRAAALSSSGGVPVAAPRKNKDINSLTADELRGMIDRAAPV